MTEKNGISEVARALAVINSEMGRIVTAPKKITTVSSANGVTNVNMIQHYFTEGVQSVVVPAELNGLGDLYVANASMKAVNLVFTNRLFKTNPSDMSSILVTNGKDTWLYNSALGRYGEYTRYITEDEVSDILQGKAKILAKESYNFAKDKTAGDALTATNITVPYTTSSGATSSHIATNEELAQLGTQQGVTLPVYASGSKASLYPFSVRFSIDDLIAKYNPNFYPRANMTTTEKQDYLQAMGAVVTVQADIVTPNFQRLHKPAQEGRPLTQGTSIYVNLSTSSASMNGRAYAIKDEYGTDTKVWRVNAAMQKQRPGSGFYPDLSGSLSFRVYDGDFSTGTSTVDASTSYLRNVTLNIAWEKPIENIFATRARMDAAEKELAAQLARIENLGG